jgi:hypothetical protein
MKMTTSTQGGAIDKRPANGKWEPYKGAHQPHDMHERLEKLATQPQVEARSEQASTAESVNIGGEGFVSLTGLFLGGNGPPTGGPP